MLLVHVRCPGCYHIILAALPCWGRCGSLMVLFVMPLYLEPCWVVIKAPDFWKFLYTSTIAERFTFLWSEEPRNLGTSSAVQHQLRGVQQIQATALAFAALLADRSVPGLRRQCLSPKSPKGTYLARKKS